MLLQLPATQAQLHVLTVFDGPEYLYEKALDGRSFEVEIEVPEVTDDVRVEHAPGDAWGSKYPPEYRSSARIDNVWFPFVNESPNYGLPAVEPEEVTDLHQSVVESLSVREDASPKQAQSRKVSKKLKTDRENTMPSHLEPGEFRLPKGE